MAVLNYAKQYSQALANAYPYTPPSALSQGKYVYFEESFEDVFILNKKHGAIKFILKKASV